MRRQTFARSGLAMAIAVAGALSSVPASAQPVLVEPPPKPGEAPVFEAVTVTGTGVTAIVGLAAPGSRIELREGAATLAAAEANALGEWLLVPVEPLAPGPHELAVAAIADGFEVVADRRLLVVIAGNGVLPLVVASGGPEPAEILQDPAAPARPAMPGPATDGIAVVTVVRGDTLWAIARAEYGRGSRYPVIFEANRDRIRDPDLIYPGQELRIPPLTQ